MALLSYTFAKLKSALEHAIGSAPDSRLASADLVNQALLSMASKHPWNWRRQPMVLSVTTKTVTSLTRSSNVVTAVVAGHGLSAGDCFRVIGCTAEGFTGEAFYVATVASVNQFTYAHTGDDGAATDGTVIPAHFDLPADFGQLVSLHRASTWKAARPKSLDRIVQYRAGSYADVIESGAYYYAICSRKQASASSVPVLRLELYPTPSAAETAALVGIYLRLPAAMTEDTDLPDVPAKFLPLLFHEVRALGYSVEHDEEGPDAARAAALAAELAAEDGGEQGDLGPIEGGILDSARPDPDTYLYPTDISPG